MKDFVKEAVIAMSNEEFNFELKIMPKLKLAEEEFAEKIKHNSEIMSMLRKRFILWTCVHILVQKH